MRTAILVALGGGLGTLLRWSVAVAVAASGPRGGLPWATLLVNLVGSFALGFLSEAFREHRLANVEVSVIFGTGMMGGFTTYSSFNLEVLKLMERGEYGRAMVYMMLTLGLALSAGVGGIAAGRWARG